jgi:outer membrane protein assembly complex protein YaeT
VPGKVIYRFTLSLVQGEMRVCDHMVVCLSGLLFVGSAGAIPQDQLKPPRSLPRGSMIQEIGFAGLHRIHPAAVKSQIATREAQEFDASRIAADLRSLNRLGWFEDISVEAKEVREHSATGSRGSPRFAILFHVKEYPFLSGVDYSGSKILSQQEIKRLLEERKFTPQVGAPANPVLLHRAAAAIQSELYLSGRPCAKVAIVLEQQPGGRVRARFQIHDGPQQRVSRVIFSGHTGTPDRVLRKQMHQIAPSAWFSGLRNKNSFTSEKIAEDRESLLAYFQDHGFPEARIGTAQVTTSETSSRPKFPWLRDRTESALLVNLPIEAGSPYRFAAVQISPVLYQRLSSNKREPQSPEVAPGQPFSARAVESLRRAWELQIHRTSPHKKYSDDCRVRATLALDDLTRTASVKLDLDPAPPYLVRRIEFRGNHRFPDRYLRRRIGLHEGFAFDDHALEAGLVALGRTAYFRPIKKEDIDVELNEAAHTANVTIRVQEIGRQRIAFSGGREQFGSSLGIAYTLFNLLNRDQLLSAQVDGGPETLRLALGFAKEGFLGSRGSLAFSIFDTFLRPRLSGSVEGPFFRTKSEGVNLSWSRSFSTVDALAVNYELSRSVTEYSLNLPSSVAGASAPALRSETSSRSAGIVWTHDASDEKMTAAASISGGWLGGRENLLRSKVEYSRIHSDPFFDRQNAWAFRMTFSGIGSYRGDAPLYSRFFCGDEMVRGLRPGELGPYLTTTVISSSGATKYAVAPAGADLIAVSNLEYRHRLAHEAEAAGFLDAGSGLLLPNWLGPARPSLLESTKRLLHASTGLEVRWTLPGLGIPLRLNYSLNIVRLDRSFLMPDGSFARVYNRLAGFGWALGPPF